MSRCSGNPIRNNAEVIDARRRAPEPQPEPALDDGPRGHDDRHGSAARPGRPGRPGRDAPAPHARPAGWRLAPGPARTRLAAAAVTNTYSSRNNTWSHVRGSP